MTVTARKYNPGFLTDEELMASFCVRTREFESILEMLRECTGPSNPHQIVIGPRGSGKTSLLLRVAAEIRRDPKLSGGFFPVVFAEESYEVDTAGEFWLESLSRLADQAPARADAPDLHRTLEDLRTIQDDQTLGDRCLGTLLDYSDRESKRVVLMVENLNMIFRDMSDRDAGWRLRKILQTEPRIILLASATSRFDEIGHPDHALYDLFRVRTLRPLDTNECAVLWGAVAGKHPSRETIRSLEILTGGSPRLVAIVARFGAARSFGELMKDLLDLVDDHTEYFKSHIESLPAQERRVYLALADLWKPATTREIAERTRIETSKCSAQLTRLTERGVVQVTGGSARRKQYYLTERLYNIYYLLRRNRGPDSLIEALIQFMESYYTPTELVEIGADIAREANGFDKERQLLHRTALARLVELPVLAGHRDELLAVIPQSFLKPDRSPVLSSGADMPKGNTDESTELAAATDQFNNAVELENRNRTEEALSAYDEVIRRFGESETPGVLGLVAKALVNKGTLLVGGGLLDGLNLEENAMSVLDEAINRSFESKPPAHPDLLSMRHVNKGPGMDRVNNALDIYDEVVQRFGESEKPDLLEAVAAALMGKGALFGVLKLPQKALAAFDEVMRRFRESKTTMVPQLAAMVLMGKGVILVKLNRFDEALAAFDELVLRFGESESPIFLRLVAEALVCKGVILGELKRPEEALATLDDAARRFGESESPMILRLAAEGLFYKGVILGELKRPEEALATLDDAVRRSGESKIPMDPQLVAMSLFYKGVTLGRLDRPEEALAAFDEVVRRFGESETLAVLEPVASAFVEKGIILNCLNRPEEALAAYDEVVRQFKDNDSRVFRTATDRALLGKANLELRISRFEAAAKTAGLFLDEPRPESPENRWRGLLIHAKATLANGDPTSCEQDIKAILEILPNLGSLPRETLDALMEFSIELGQERMFEIIQASPSAKLLLPLTTALEQEIGREPRVAREVEEVAQDIRRDLAKLRRHEQTWR